MCRRNVFLRRMVLRILLRRSGARKLSEERTLYACVDDRFWRRVKRPFGCANLDFVSFHWLDLA